MKKLGFLLACSVILSGCGVMPEGFFSNRDRPDPVVEAAPEPAEDEIPDNARTAEQFDTTSADDRAAALEAASSTDAETDLGLTIASLGDVTETGIWVKTPLVTEGSKGRVEFTRTGKAVAVDLIPLDGEAGSGSRISLAAMRLLEVDLTALAELRVFRVN
ncbi:MAG: hypothetical protein AAFY25_03540 [Pseudomonadota bacterium]